MYLSILGKGVQGITGGGCLSYLAGLVVCELEEANCLLNRFDDWLCWVSYGSSSYGIYGGGSTGHILEECIDGAATIKKNYIMLFMINFKIFH